MFCRAAAESCGDVNTAGAEQMSRPRAGRARIARFWAQIARFVVLKHKRGDAWFGEHPPGQEVVLLCSPLLPTPIQRRPPAPGTACSSTAGLNSALTRTGISLNHFFLKQNKKKSFKITSSENAFPFKATTTTKGILCHPMKPISSPKPHCWGVGGGDAPTGPGLATPGAALHLWGAPSCPAVLATKGFCPAQPCTGSSA